MADIVLATLNARYIHSAFGLRYLLANLDELADRATILEFVINDNNIEMAAQILLQQPKIVGFGVYIWNVEQTTRLMADLKRIRPDVKLVIGGPEVSYELDEQEIVRLSDYVITGEAEFAFRNLCSNILSGQTATDKIQNASVPKLNDVKMPYHLYDADDIANRVIYVELSRGCPFTCEFCLSSLDIPVRTFDLENFLDQLDNLIRRGARQFKFVDRTFNLNLRISRTVLQFFLDRYQPEMFLHFELIPDRLPEGLRELIRQFPAGVLQFEIGIQTLNPEVEKLISRRQNHVLMEENFRWLRTATGVHIHADLIVGLPGETLPSFAAGFDRLYSFAPQEIQVGILKRLRGTPIIRHDATWEMKYSPHPPYEILCNQLLDFEDIHRMRRFARHWDLIANSGNFVNTMPLLCPAESSAFESFMQLSQWLFESNRRMHAISLLRLVELLLDFLIHLRHTDPLIVATALHRDYCGNGRRETPTFLKSYGLSTRQSQLSHAPDLPTRQRKRIESQQSEPTTSASG